MRSPATRLAGAIVVLAIFYVALFRGTVPPAAAELASAEDDARQSRAAYESGRYGQALDSTRRLVAGFPTQHVYRGRLAWIYHYLGRYQDEAAEWEAFMRASPTPIDACPAIGEAYRQAHEAPSSLRAFERCRTLDPGDADLVFFTGRAHEQLQHAEEARSRYRDALKLAPGHADALLGLARLDLHDGRLARAQKAALEVLDQHPRHADALLIAGLVAQRTGDAARTREYLERALAVAETYVDVHIALGILDFSQNRLAAARAHFERADALDPSRRAEIAVWLERTGGSR